MICYGAFTLHSCSIQLHSCSTCYRRWIEQSLYNIMVCAPSDAGGMVALQSDFVHPCTETSWCWPPLVYSSGAKAVTFETSVERMIKIGIHRCTAAVPNLLVLLQVWRWLRQVSLVHPVQNAWWSWPPSTSSSKPLNGSVTHCGDDHLLRLLSRVASPSSLSVSITI